MKRGALPRYTLVTAISHAIMAVGDIKATGPQLVRLEALYRELIEARAVLGLEPHELHELGLDAVA